jgi:Arc/MetJ-type ribon-helix-helix transcriptional regulator
MPGKTKRLEDANFERAEAAVRWEDAANKADETGRASDVIKAAEDDRVLDAADRKIKKIEAEP